LQDSVLAEDIARAQGCSEVADLLSSLTSVCCEHFLHFIILWVLVFSL